MRTLKIAVIVAVTWLPLSVFAENANLGEIEVQRCEEKIAMVQREVVGRYESALQEMQLGYQKLADLEGALAVRAERQRLSKDGRLGDQNLVAEPKSLRTLQTQSLAKIKELTAQLVAESVPKLIEYKKSLTIAGKLDEALAAQAGIERLQNGYVPLSKPEPGTVTSADTLLQTYAADRARADKVYKGRKVVVRGILGGVRVDPDDPKQFLLYLGGTSGGWVQCAFTSNDFRFREEKQFNGSLFVIIPRGDENAAIRVPKGQTLEVRGLVDGFEESVRLAKCDFGK